MEPRTEAYLKARRAHAVWLADGVINYCRASRQNIAELMRTHPYPLKANYLYNMRTRRIVGYADLMAIILIMSRLGLTTEDLVKYHGEEYQREKRIRKAKNVDK